MKEFKILAVIIALVGVTYYGIEPYAHHVMHPEPAPADFSYDGKQEAQAIRDAGGENAETDAAELEAFWAKAQEISALVANADAAAGKEQVIANCTGCHSLDAEGIAAPMSNTDSAMSYGVVPPDLSKSDIYDATFLAAFFLDPVKATHLQHKYAPNSGKVYPMPSHDWLPAQDLANMIAYLHTIPQEKLEGTAANKAAFEAACGRCHSMGYAGIQALTDADTLKGYIGAKAPDLSQYIKSRGRHYLENFIHDPQRLLHGTGMPRVGLTAAAQEQVITYMEEVGDAKKAERESLGWKVMLYMLVFAIFALAWKKQIWRDIH